MRKKRVKHFHRFSRRKKHFSRSFKKRMEDFGPFYEKTEENDFSIFLQRFSYPEKFDQKVKIEAQKVWKEYQQHLKSYALDKKSLHLWKDREDLTDWDIFSIDGEDAKDFDDAISLKKEKGEYHLGVHIADVSAFVAKNSELDQNAGLRTTSVYLIDRVIPMLPRELSNDICSIVAGEIRLAVSVFFVYDAKGVLQKTRFCNSIIKSLRNCTYKEVQDFYDGKQSLPAKIEKSLVEMKKLKEKLSAKRFSEGSMSFEEQEQKWIYQGNKIVDVEVKKRVFAEELIEEFMLEANKVVSQELLRYGVGIFREHESPAKEKVQLFYQLLKKMKKKLPRRGSENPLEKTGENKYHLFLQSIKDEKERVFFSKILLTSMQQARYSHKNKGHYGLGFKYYTHFTSPIRRYSDLVVHRILKEILKNEHGERKITTKKYSGGVKTSKETSRRARKEGFDNESLKKIAEHCSEMERKAVKAEREFHKLKSIRYLNNLSPQQQKESFDAFVTGITFRGNVFVRLEKTGIEGMIKSESFPWPLWYDESSLALFDKKTKILQVGFPLKVRFLRAVAADLFVEFLPDDDFFLF